MIEDMVEAFIASKTHVGATFREIQKNVPMDESNDLEEILSLLVGQDRVFRSGSVYFTYDGD